MRWRHSGASYVLLNLWATWCAPCVAELPALVRLQARVPGLRVLAVNTDRKTGVGCGRLPQGAQWRPRLVPYRRYRRWPCCTASRRCGLPLTTVLIDPEGKVIAPAPKGRRSGMHPTP